MDFDSVKQEQEVNPIDVWEGIDTGEDTGRNCLTKLAIHILSVVANLAGCERAFSHMGLVHTGIRSKRGIEKVRKATMVGMDIKQMHMDAGLLRTLGKRNFTSGTATGEQNDELPVDAGSDLGDIEGLLDFDQLSDHLIAGAVSANGERDVGDVDENELPQIVPDVPALRPSHPQPSLTISIPPVNSATLSCSAQPTANPMLVKVSIPLKILFKYSTNVNLPQPEASDGMNTFWRGGIQNLEKEMEAYELLTLGAENTDEINPEIPTILICM